MNPSILNQEVQDFILSNLNTDVSKLLFKSSPFKDITVQELVEQIEAKKRCKMKLPTWHNEQNIYYPNKLNIEQTSSEITAEYKSKLVSGISLIDITSGLGIDSFYFAKEFKNVVSCELNQNLSKIAKHNFKKLNANNINVKNEDGIDYIKSSHTIFDCIYVDPSRRHDSKGKVFFLIVFLPNIPEHIDMLFKHSNTILIKVSPMLDISMGISELEHVKEVHIVAVQNEVKELLFLLELNYIQDLKIETINIINEKAQHFSFNKKEELEANSKLSQPLAYLYEPNSALLKSGAFNLISEKLSISKLHKHTHLYTSNKLVEFPGRSFRIDSILDFNKKQLKSIFKGKKMNIATRNFPITVEELKKQFKINDGGDVYAFFTTNCNDSKIVILTSKV